MSGGAPVAVLAAVIIAVVCVTIGSSLIRTSQVDYTTYTERVTAVVSEIEIIEDKDGDKRTQIYVDYQVGQEYFERQPLSGTWTSTPEVGDTFELAFPPGSPEDAVTVSMLDSGTQRVLLWVGIGVIAFGALLVLVLGILNLSKSGRIGPAHAPPARGPGAPIAAPVDPATLPQPWPWEQVVAHLAMGVRGHGYRVTNLGDKVEVADKSGTYVRRLEPTGKARYRPTTVYFDAHGRGMDRAAWLRNSGEDPIGDAAMARSSLDRGISGVLRDAGWKTKLGGEVIGAGVMAALGLGGGLVALIVIFLF